MNKRLIPLIALASLLSCSSALANGGGYFHSGISYTGTVSVFEPSGTQSVRIMDELLTVDVGQTSAHVEVRYILKNQTDKKAKVRFGFPVEQLSNDRRSLAFMATRDKDMPVGTMPTDCRNYAIELSGKKISAKFSGQEFEPDERFVGIRGWFVSDASFTAGEEKTMTIRYDSDYVRSGFGVSEDALNNSLVFKYRLSTGAAWEGPIERGRIVIRAAGANPEDVEVLKPLNRFHKTDAGWEWDFEGLEPTLADDIEVQAVPESKQFGYRRMNGSFANGDDSNPVTFEQVGKKWRALHRNYAVKASSELPPFGEENYKAANVRGNSSSVWCEGAPGNGVGEWLELTPEVSQPLESIDIVSGYASDKELFAANARPKKIQVKLNDSFVFESPVSDTRKQQRLMITGYNKPVKKIRLTIKDVYPGSRYEDMCIADVALAVKLDKAPKIQPAR